MFGNKDDLMSNCGFGDIWQDADIVHSNNAISCHWKMYTKDLKRRFSTPVADAIRCNYQDHNYRGGVVQRRAGGTLTAT